MADKYYAGKSGKVTINVGSTVTEIAVKNWKASHSIQELDTTSTTSGGKYEVQGGIEKVEGSFEAHWNATTSPFSAGLGLSAGTTLSNLELYVNASGEKFDMDGGFVKSVDVEVGVDDVVKYTVNFVSNGNFTLPS